MKRVNPDTATFLNHQLGLGRISSLPKLGCFCPSTHTKIDNLQMCVSTETKCRPYQEQVVPTSLLRQPWPEIVDVI